MLCACSIVHDLLDQGVLLRFVLLVITGSDLSRLKVLEPGV